MSVIKFLPILIKNSQLRYNIPKLFSLTIPNVLQLLSQPEELYVKLNILIAKIFNSKKSSPYESHYLFDTFMKYNVIILRLQITTYKDEKKKKTIFYVLVGSVGSHTILHAILQFLRSLCNSKHFGEVGM